MLKPGQRMAFVRENFHLKNTIIYPNKGINNHLII
jgi:hypothetical protein